MESKSKEQYASSKVWEQKYKSLLYDKLQWLTTPALLHKHIEQDLPPNKEAKILEIGCGSSRLSEYLYSLGYSNITCLDLSKDIITKRQKKNPKIKYMVADIMDYRALTEDTYDLIIEKCAFDCIFCSSNFLQNVLRVLNKCYHSLTSTGVLISVSHAKPKLRKFWYRNKLAPFSLQIKLLKSKETETMEKKHCPIAAIEESCYFIYCCRKQNRPQMPSKDQEFVQEKENNNVIQENQEQEQNSEKGEEEENSQQDQNKEQNNSAEEKENKSEQNKADNDNVGLAEENKEGQQHLQGNIQEQKQGEKSHEHLQDHKNCQNGQFLLGQNNSQKDAD